jgi:hypothetical protein
MYLGVPCLTVRENTERPITVSMGTNVLVGRDPDKLRMGLSRVLGGKAKKETVPPPLGWTRRGSASPMFWLGSCQECKLRSESLPQSVGSSVAIHAQRDQVRFVVVAAPAPEVQMVYLQALHCPTGLTSPAIALKHLAM